MKTLAIAMSKIISKVGSALNRGSSLPGFVSRKIDKNILSKLDLGENIVIVTGTNGKTSTTKYISDTLKSNGYSVTSNASGANMPQGITTEILNNVNIKGKLNSDYLILEVDEAYVKEINRAIKANYLVVTNLFKDQVDRFPDINKVKNIIVDGIVPNNTLILNADDPFTTHISSIVDNDVKYFGYKESVVDGMSEDDHKCPNCNETLSYTSVVYNHLGNYRCTCGFKRPESVDFEVSAYDIKDESVIINDYKYNLNNSALYNTYNYLATVAVVQTLGMSEEKINAALSSAVVGRGRMETFLNGEHKSFVNLVKNEVGLNETLAYIESIDEPKCILFLSVHSRVPDGPNIDWLNGIDVKHMNRKQVTEFIVTGDEALRVGKLFEENGIDKSKLKVIENLEDAVQYTLSKQDTAAYLLANYTSLPDVRRNVFKQ